MKENIGKLPWSISLTNVLAEVDCHGKKISNLEWRHVYMTQTGKEYIYGLSDRGWKIYTKDVLEDLTLECIDTFDKNREW